MLRAIEYVARYVKNFFVRLHSFFKHSDLWIWLKTHFFFFLVYFYLRQQTTNRPIFFAFNVVDLKLDWTRTWVANRDWTRLKLNKSTNYSKKSHNNYKSMFLFGIFVWFSSCIKWKRQYTYMMFIFYAHSLNNLNIQPCGHGFIYWPTMS